jgi:nitrite transporter NirC
MDQTIEKIALAAQAKAAGLRRDPLGFLVLSMLAGVYVGFGIVLIFAIGAPLAAAGSPLTKALMGAAFGVALSLVIFAGSELFTGNHLFLTLGTFVGRSRLLDLALVWGWCFLGNLVGSLLLAWLVVQAGVFGADPQRSFVLQIAATKMTLPFWTLFVRGILCNWLVCLAVWMAQRTQSEAARLVLIFWCLFAFIGAGFEHSVANMSLLGIALFLPHDAAVSWSGYVANLVPVTLGNIVGGAGCVAGLYWLASPLKRLAQAGSPAPVEPARALQATLPVAGTEPA